MRVDNSSLRIVSSFSGLEKMLHRVLLLPETRRIDMVIWCGLRVSISVCLTITKMQHSFWAACMLEKGLAMKNKRTQKRQFEHNLLICLYVVLLLPLFVTQLISSASSCTVWKLLVSQVFFSFQCHSDFPPNLQHGSLWLVHEGH